MAVRRAVEVQARADFRHPCTVSWRQRRVSAMKTHLACPRMAQQNPMNTAYAPTLCIVALALLSIWQSLATSSSYNKSLPVQEGSR